MIFQKLKIAVVTLGLFFLLSETVLATEPQMSVIFQDVQENHPYVYAIKNLKERGFIKGYQDSTFRPDTIISRAEALAMLVNIINISRQTHAMIYPPPPDTSFTDVPTDSWYKPYVDQGVGLNIATGYADKTFKPMDPVKLQEALKMGFQTFRITIPGQKLKDTPWFQPYFDFAKVNRLVDPSASEASSFYYSPFDPLTRGDMAELIFRLTVFRDTEKPFDSTIEWNTFSHDANFFEIKYPATFSIFKGSKNSVVWKPDEKNGQAWMTRVTPLSARLSISLREKPNDPSLATAKAWFSKLKQEQLKLYGPPISQKNPALPITEKFIEFREIIRGGKSILLVDIPKKRLLDAYLFLNPGKVLVLYGEYGHSNLSDFLKEQLETIIRTYRYIEPKPPSPPPLTPEQKLEKVREAILIEGKGLDIFKLLPDKTLIETDAIGVGTGPVDYFYSQEINATIKYERSSKTILNVQEGRVTSF